MNEIENSELDDGDDEIFFEHHSDSPNGFYLLRRLIQFTECLT